MQLRIAICSTYPPRQCGLATFASDLAASLARAPGVGTVGIISLDRTTPGCPQPSSSDPPPHLEPRLVGRIDDSDPTAYRKAANAANEWADVVVVQHEFGIFGGTDGVLLLEFLDALEVPYILTLHTVLSVFTEGQLDVLRRACAGAAAITVFTATARRLLLAQAVVDAARIEVVGHGAPQQLYGVDRARARRRLGCGSSFVLSSFGLVSEGKGLELAIEALRRLVDGGIDGQLVIAGRTHPEVARREGDAYLDSLRSLARDLELTDRVRFFDRFLAIDAIAELLAATDVFVTPYRNPEQIVSGALTFALAAGCPVVSTPYSYAYDQLRDGAGVVVGTRDPDAFALAIHRYATDDTSRRRARDRATVIGESMRWSAVGARMARLCASVTAVRVGKVTAVPVGNRATTSPPPEQSPVVTTHLRTLVDDTGIVQHARGVIPLHSSGYCVDDVARLISVAERLGRSELPCDRPYSDYWRRVAARGVSFLFDAHQPGSSNLSNFMRWDRTWLDRPHFGDHVGRSIAALLHVADTLDAPDDVCAGPLARSILSHWPDRPPLHTDAFALIAQATHPGLADPRRAPQMLKRLVALFGGNDRPDWFWPEERLRYDHARIPQALIAGGLLLADDQAVEIGLRSLRWYTQRCEQDDHFRFPGHRGLGLGEEICWSGDEQPLEAVALLEAHLWAEAATGDQWHGACVERCVEWFAGRNRLRVAVGDSRTGAGFDSIGPHDVNRNCGAESTLAFTAARQWMTLRDEVRAALRTPRRQLVVATPTPRASAPTPPTRTLPKEESMLIGVKSSIVLDIHPDRAALDAFEDEGRNVTIIDLTDGRVRVESFAPLDCEHPDLVGALRAMSEAQRSALDSLRRS